MDTSILGYVFNVCIIVGFAIPVVNILTGWFGDFLNFSSNFDADIDVDLDTDIDVDTDADIDVSVGAGGVIHFNMMCLCLCLVVFGVVGNIARQWMSSILLTVVFIAAGALIGAVFYVLMYKLVIVRLKKSTVYTISYNDLVGRRAEVTLRITDDSIGMISVLDSTGAYISFRARKDPELTDRMAEVLQKGDTVIITEVREKLCHVSTSPSEFVTNSIENI